MKDATSNDFWGWSVVFRETNYKDPQISVWY